MSILNGKIALVTGANSGMGMATTAALKRLFGFSEQLAGCKYQL